MSAAFWIISAIVGFVIPLAVLAVTKRTLGLVLVDAAPLSRQRDAGTGLAFLRRAGTPSRRHG